MTALQHAIDNLTKLYICFGRAGRIADATKVLHELLGYEDVRDGVPRARREMQIHHVAYLDLYRSARTDAEKLKGQEAQR